MRTVPILRSWTLERHRRSVERKDSVQSSVEKMTADVLDAIRSNMACQQHEIDLQNVKIAEISTMLRSLLENESVK